MADLISLAPYAKSVLAFGVVALAYLVGTCILRELRSRARTEVNVNQTAMAVALGMAGLTPAFVLLAFYGIFVPEVVGGIGWLGLTVWVIARRRTRWQWSATVSEVVMLLGALVFSIVAIYGRDEPWGAGRDQQVYAEFAVLLAETGHATTQIRPGDAADAELLRAAGTDREVSRYLGVTRTARNGAIDEASYFPLGWPAWLAFAYAIGGYPALHAANSLVFALGALLIHPVLRRSTGTPLATAAVVALLALPSSIWIAGVALSEPLAMVLWLATMALFALSGRHASRWVPIVVFAAATVRIDALVLIPALIVAYFANAALKGSEAAMRRARHFATAMVLSLVAVIGWYASFNASYFNDNIGDVKLVIIATVLAGLMTTGNASWYRLARRMLEARGVAYGIAMMVVAMAAYALVVRPNMHPFSIIHNGTGLDGSRDYRENSLRNLAVYVGWPILLLAITGTAIGAIRFARPTTSLVERVLLMTGVAFSVLYLWAPLVSPDHPWAIRRFVPVVVPMAVVLATLALRHFVRRRAGGRAIAAGVMMVGAASEAAVASAYPLLTLRENRGAAEMIASIDSSMPEALVVCDLAAGNVGIILSIARHRRVLVVDFQQPGPRAAIGRWLAAKAHDQKAAWFLYGQEALTAGARMSPVGKWHFERRTLVGTTQPPPRKVSIETVRIALMRSDGVDTNIAFTGFGGTPTWGISDTGFFASEATQFGTLRMTNGAALLDVPSNLLHDAAALRFKWFSWAPHGERRETTVRIGGHAAWQGALPPGVSTTIVPVPRPLPPGAVRVEIDSATFDTRALNPADRRGQVGIGLIDIRALLSGWSTLGDRIVAVYR